MFHSIFDLPNYFMQPRVCLFDRQRDEAEETETHTKIEIGFSNAQYDLLIKNMKILNVCLIKN